jgi:hypothetical protein
MKTKLVSLLVAVVAASSLMFTGIATARTSAATTVTIKGPQGDFAGKIKSSNHKCLGHRLVRLYKAHKAKGPFRKTGNSDTSERQGSVGVWSMGNTGLKDGFFYAQAKATPICKSGRSRVLHLVNGVPH